MRRAGTAAALVAAVALAVSAATADAHTGVKELVPASGSTATGAVRIVGVRFEDRIVTGRVTVTTAGGRVITPRESGLVSRGTFLRSVFRSALADGWYRVAWRARFEDGHSKSGSWRFRVR